MVDKPKKNFWHRFLKRYIIVVYNQGNFKERISISLSPINLILVLSSMVVFTMLITSLLFLYTPIKTAIPGFSTGSLSPARVFELQNRVDSFEKAARQTQIYYDSLIKILKGDTGKTSMFRQIPGHALFRFAGYNDKKGTANTEKEPSKNTKITTISPLMHLFPPVSGYISQHYDVADDHYALDIVTAKDAPVKVVDDGMVVFSEWSAETGNVIIVQHANNLISIYKHNSVLLKNVGTFVNRGDVIALVGNSGEFSTGPHLHFELWVDGSPLDPENFISF